METFDTYNGLLERVGVQPESVRHYDKTLGSPVLTLEENGYPALSHVVEEKLYCPENESINISLNALGDIISDIKILTENVTCQLRVGGVAREFPGPDLAGVFIPACSAIYSDLRLILSSTTSQVINVTLKGTFVENSARRALIDMQYRTPHLQFGNGISVFL